LTREFLERQKLEIGSSLYNCLYKNNPISDETCVFKMDDFSFYGAIKPDDLHITVTCDPAGEGEDYTAIVTVGTDNNMDMHILDVINEHLQPSQIVEKIINLQYKYKFSMLGIETNFFRGMLEPEIKRRRDEEHKNHPQRFSLFGVTEFEASSKRGSGKHARIMSLQPLHERRAIKFPGEKFELLEGAFSELSWQMVQYTHDGAKSPHDDAIDALAYQVQLIRRGGMVKKAQLPVNSPAWLEREKWNKEVAFNNKLPRRLRRKMPDLAFS
jgi:predicted phage terminase large subunit-like protein